MKTVLVSLAVLALGLSTASAQTAGGSAFSGSNSSNCKVIELKTGQSPPTSLATPMAGLPTARGKAAASDTQGQIPTGSQADGSRVVVDSNGNCSIYRSEARQPNPSR